MIVRSTTVVNELTQIFAQIREDLQAYPYNRGMKRRMLKAYDLRRDELLAVARRKWIFFKGSYNEVWGLNWYHTYNHKKQAKIENTAYMLITAGLKFVGTKYKWTRS